MRTDKTLPAPAQGCPAQSADAAGSASPAKAYRRTEGRVRCVSSGVESSSPRVGWERAILRELQQQSLRALGEHWIARARHLGEQITRTGVVTDFFAGERKLKLGTQH